MSIISLNINVYIYKPNQKTKVTEWIKKTRPIYFLPTRDHFRSKDTQGMKFEGTEKGIQCKQGFKNPGVAILISEKIFNTKKVTRDKHIA